MNLLFVIPEMSMGGAQRSVDKISTALALNHNVWIVVFNRTHVVAKASQKQLLSLEVSSGSGAFVKMRAFALRVIRLRALKRKLNIDVSISFLEGADYINVLSASQEKVILSIRGSKVHDENMHRSGFEFRRWLIRFLYKKAHAIVCVNKGIAREMTEYYGIKNVPVSTIYNFYDIPEARLLAGKPLPQAVMNLYNCQTIVMSGRIAREKGHRFVVKLFAELKKQVQHVKLLVVGDGPDKDILVSLAESLHLSVAYTVNELARQPDPDLFITGDQENVFSYLKHGTIYVLNSSSEGFPNGLAEAMICGLPVVAADCPYGPREILCQTPEMKELTDIEFADYGVLLPMPGEEPSASIFDCWMQAILQLLSSEQLRLGYSNKGSDRMEGFTGEKIVKMWRQIVEGE